MRNREPHPAAAPAPALATAPYRPTRATSPRSRRRRLPALVETILFVWLWGAFSYFHHGPSWGPLSRLNLVMAMVDDGTLTVDRYHADTGDNAFFRGRFYHEKAPGGAFLGLLPYRVYAWLAPRPERTEWRAWSRYAGRALYVAGSFSTALISALAGVFLFRLGRRMFGHPAAALGAVVIYAFATNAFPYAGQLQSHQMAGALTAAAVYLAWRVRRRERPPRPATSAALGLCLGWLVAVEYQDAAIALAVGLYLVTRAGAARRSLAWVFLGALPPALLVGWFNWASFGSPFSPGYAHLWGGWERLHRGALLGFGPPRPRVLLELLAGQRLGLFIYAPAVLLALPGALLWRRAGGKRAELLLAAGVLLLFPLYMSGFANVLSGPQYGPRMLVAMLPFACLLTVPAVMRLPRLSAAVGVVSGVLVLAGTAVCPEVLSRPAPPILHRVLLPFAEGDFPRSIYGYVAGRCTEPILYGPFNLGMVLGLRGHASLLPYLAWWATGFTLLLHLAGRLQDRPPGAGAAGSSPAARRDRPA